MPVEKPFVHLHLHTEYSLLDGACRIKPLMERLKSLGQSAVAITDHGVMYGCVEFFKAAREAGIEPVIGCEVYVATRGRGDKVSHIDGNNHLVLLCKNETGYQNLIRMVSLGFIEGFYSKPRIDKQLLATHAEGLVCLSACLAGEIPQALLAGNYEGAREAALWYDGLFGRGNYYIEVQDHGMEEQRAVLPGLIRLSRETGIPLAATNDAHYLRREDARTQQVLLCIQTKKTLADDDKLEFATDEFYVKSADEMYGLFGEIPEACANTAKIAKMCRFGYEFGKTKLPTFEVPGGGDSGDYFTEMCEAGLRKRYGEDPGEEAHRRLDYELSVIKRMGYVNYYLIVADFVRYARESGIPVGPGRGSGAGSLAAYCVGITDIDPLRYGLLFERFLNPERVSMPDFDIDFCNERRGEVIDYVNRKYGEDHVAQIITFGTLKPRQAIRDVARVLGLPYQKADVMAKLVPMDPGMTLGKALSVSRQLAEDAQSDPQVAEVLDIAKRIEGMPRNASTHAAGVVITPRATYQYVPLSTNDGVNVTQFPMGAIEELGLLKMDILGLRNLTVIADAERMIRAHTPEFSIGAVPYDDGAVYALLSCADTDGVFQMESGGMRQTLLGVKPTCFEDIIAIISLYRPGPMDSIPAFQRNRHNPSLIRYKTPMLAPILNVTYGVTLYQEQVMRICRELAGYSYGQADLVRRAMSKKKHDVMEKERTRFIYGSTVPGQECPGCVANGVPEQVASELFDDLTDFASYAFNKSHAAAYAVVAYRTAWLRCHYPREYMAALLTSVQGFGTSGGGGSGKVLAYINAAVRLGIKVLPPDINESGAGFTVEGANIRYGLLALKNVGSHLIDALVAERRENGAYRSMYDFCCRTRGAAINSKALEAFIYSGCFDRIEPNRHAMKLVCEPMLKHIEGDRRKNLDGQVDLFGMAAGAPARGSYQMPQVEEYSKEVRLQQEKDVSGLFLSGHPLEEYREVIAKEGTATIGQLVGEDAQPQDDRRVVIVCAIVSVKYFTTKNNDSMAFTTIEDLTGSMEALIFPKILMDANDVVKDSAVVILRGRISAKEEEEPKIIAEEILPISSAQPGKLKAAAAPGRAGLHLRVPSRGGDTFNQAVKLLNIFEGDLPVYFRFEDSGQAVRAPKRMWTLNNATLIRELRALLGEANVAVVGGEEN